MKPRAVAETASGHLVIDYFGNQLMIEGNINAALIRVPAARASRRFTCKAGTAFMQLQDTAKCLSLRDRERRAKANKVQLPVFVEEAEQ